MTATMDEEALMTNRSGAAAGPPGPPFAFGVPGAKAPAA